MKKVLLLLAVLSLFSIAAFWGYFYMEPGDSIKSPCNSPSVVYDHDGWWRVACNNDFAYVHCVTELYLDEQGDPPMLKLMLTCSAR